MNQQDLYLKKNLSMTNITKKGYRIFIIINCYTYRIINIARITKPWKVEIHRTSLFK